MKINIFGEEKLTYYKINCFIIAEINVLYSYIKDNDMYNIEKIINICKNINSKHKKIISFQQSIFNDSFYKIKEDNLLDNDNCKIIANILNEFKKIKYIDYKLLKEGFDILA